MTRQQAERTLELWRRRLIPEWSVHIDWDKPPEDDEAYADIWRPDSYHRAHVRIGKPFLDELDDETQVQTLLHELLHLLLRDLARIPDSLIGIVSRDVYTIVQSQWDHHEESVVDRLAWSLVGLGPPPPSVSTAE